MNSVKIFVCGALAQGRVHHSKFLKTAEFLGHGWIQGSIYRLEAGYPVFLLQGDQSITGEVYQLHFSDILMSLMDEFHGYSVLQPERSLYLKSQVRVLRDNETTELMTTYVLNPTKLPKSACKIESGDWIQDLSQNPPLSDKMTDRQKEYVKKLGRTTGRDIVPIQLEIYRELMNLGLIVDKGRRLALSKLGQEVLRFLE